MTLGAETAHSDNNDAAAIALGRRTQAITGIFGVASFEPVDANDASEEFVVIFHVHGTLRAGGTKITLLHRGVFEYVCLENQMAAKEREIPRCGEIAFVDALAFGGQAMRCAECAVRHADFSGLGVH